MSDQLERVRVLHKISSHIDRAINCLRNGEFMVGDYNVTIKETDKFYSYYNWQSYDIKFFCGTLAELKAKLNES